MPPYILFIPSAKSRSRVSGSLFRAMAFTTKRGWPFPPGKFEHRETRSRVAVNGETGRTAIHDEHAAHAADERNVSVAAGEYARPDAAEFRFQAA